MKLDYYERHLLALAVEACGDSGMLLSRNPYSGGWGVCFDYQRLPIGSGGTREAALANFLTEMGVEYPERPSAEAVHETSDLLNTGLLPLSYWASLDPLLVAAVLEASR